MASVLIAKIYFAGKKDEKQIYATNGKPGWWTSEKWNSAVLGNSSRDDLVAYCTRMHDWKMSYLVCWLMARAFVFQSLQMWLSLLMEINSNLSLLPVWRTFVCEELPDMGWHSIYQENVGVDSMLLLNIETPYH